MKAKIDIKRCTGCGICASLCPKGIEMIDGKAKIKDENTDCLNNAANACPRGAILLGEGEFRDEETNSPSQDYNQDNWIGQGRGQGSGQGRGMGQGSGQGRGRGKW